MKQNVWGSRALRFIIWECLLQLLVSDIPRVSENQDPFDGSQMTPMENTTVIWLLIIAASINDRPVLKKKRTLARGNLQLHSAFRVVFCCAKLQQTVHIRAAQRCAVQRFYYADCAVKYGLFFMKSANKVRCG